MNIGDNHSLLEFKPLGFIQSPLGELAVFEASVGDMDKVRGYTGFSVKDVEPRELVRQLLPFILHRKSALKTDDERPDTPSLTIDEINALPDPVIEAALELFIASQEHLYKKFTTELVTNDKGEQVSSSSFRDVQHPKLEGESNIDYLHRLYSLEEQEMKKQMEKLAGSFFGTANFSAGLKQNIKDTLLVGNSLSKAFEAFRQPLPDIAKLTHMPNEVSTKSPIEQFDAMAKGANDARWAPFNAVNQRLDELIKISASSGEFMVQMNQTQTCMASEIKASGEEATKIGRDSLKIAKLGFWVTVFVVLLTLIGLVIAVATWWGSDESTQKAAKQTEQVIGGLTDVKSAIVSQGQSSTQVVGGLSDVKAAIVNQGQSSARDVKDMLDELKTSRIEQNKKFDAILTDQAKLLEAQAKQRNTDQETIEALRIHITQLEDQIRKLSTQGLPKKDGQ